MSPGVWADTVRRKMEVQDSSAYWRKRGRSATAFCARRWAISLTPCWPQRLKSCSKMALSHAASLMKFRLTWNTASAKRASPWCLFCRASAGGPAPITSRNPTLSYPTVKSATISLRRLEAKAPVKVHGPPDKKQDAETSASCFVCFLPRRLGLSQSLSCCYR